MTPGILNMKCFEIRKNIEERWDCITVKIITMFLKKKETFLLRPPKFTGGFWKTVWHIWLCLKLIKPLGPVEQNMTYSTAWSLSYGIADNLNKDAMDVFILWYIYIIWEFRRNVPNLKDNAGWPIKKCVCIRINPPYSLCKTIWRKSRFMNILIRCSVNICAKTYGGFRRESSLLRARSKMQMKREEETYAVGE